MTLPIAEARRNDEIIALADSQVLRWLDELNGITDAESKAREIKVEIRRLRKEQNSGIWRSAIRDGKPINLYIPSKRMRELLINWINNTYQGGNNIA